MMDYEWYEDESDHMEEQRKKELKEEELRQIYDADEKWRLPRSMSDSKVSVERKRNDCLLSVIWLYV